jgi:uncharacterized repeat protein (TIGR01451 family)
VLHVTARVLGSGSYANSAEVTAAGQPDANDTYGDGAGNDHATATASPNGTVDLSLAKVVDQPTPAVGTNVTFTLTLTNAATFSDATGVAVTDLLPSGYSHVSDDGAGSYVPATGVWSVGSLLSGGSRTLHITARVLGSGTYVNAAEVTAADQPDANDTYGDGAGNDHATATANPNGTVDLALTKTVDQPTPSVGTNVTFTITVSNAAGFSNATGVVVTDLLPTGYSYVSDDGAGSYVAATGIWNAGSIAAGGSHVLHITATVLGSGAYTNAAEVTACDEPDADDTYGNGAGNDFGAAATAPVPTVDLSLNKAVDVPVPAVGTNVVFTITVVNAAGMSDASGVVVTDVLPTGYTYVSDDGAGSYVPATGSWSVGNVPAGGNRVLHVTATVLGSGSYTNAAEVKTADQPDANDTYGDGAGSDHDTATANPNGTVDLSLSKIVSQPTPSVGTIVTFTITVQNAAGFSPASGVVVRDLLPAGYAYVSDDGAGSYVSATGIWSVGNVAAGGSRALDITARVLGAGSYVNAAEVTACDDPDANDTYGDGAGDDFASVSTAPLPRVDLSLAKIVDQPTPAVGTNVVFTITVSNAATFSDATGVVVGDLLPNGYAYIGDDGTGSYVSATGVWNVGNVAAGGNHVLHITARVLGSGSYTNAAEVTACAEPDVSDTYGDGAGNDFGSVATAPVPTVDLSLTKIVDQPTPSVGANVVFTITVQNAAAFSDATGVIVGDVLPNGYTYVGDDGAGSYVPATGVWSVGNIPSGGSRTLNITARVLGAGSYVNAAEVTAADEPDANDAYGDGAGNDHATATANPNGAVDLSLTKIVDQPAPAVGGNVTFTITVSNAAGFTDATGLVVTDLLPGGYAYVSDDGAGSYIPATGVWSAGSVASGASRTLNITARVLGSGSYVNAAEVTAADEPDANDIYGNGAGNDFGTASTAPVPTVDLSLTKTVDQPTPAVGGNVTFTITVQNASGFSDAPGVLVTDLLPNGYSYVSDDGAGSYVPATGVWSVGNVAASGIRVLHIIARVLATGSYTNASEVTAGALPDANDVYGDGAGNDYATATASPNGAVDLSLAKTVDQPAPAVGTNVVFTITVQNAATFSDATGVVVTDVLPSGYTYVSDDGAGATSRPPACGASVTSRPAARAPSTSRRGFSAPARTRTPPRSPRLLCPT